MRVTQIDHVEIEVPERYEAARWYRVALGFEICRDYEFWAEVADGPLMISTDDGETKLALFDGQPQRAVRPVGIRRIAFRIGGEDFVTLIHHLDSLKGGDVVRRSEISDHGKSFSVYFSDPYGNKLEVTTYDRDAVRTQIE
ncbi:MAG TPA: VOC family protein [Chthoniobacterales bacterium]|nr:VOC family protein [Chthoniobacterales bacterium]